MSGACGSQLPSPCSVAFPPAAPLPPLAQICSPPSLVLCNCPTSDCRASAAFVFDFPLRPVVLLRPRETIGSHGSLSICFRTCTGSTTARSRYGTRLVAPFCVAFAVPRGTRHSDFALSRLNTRPMRSPVNASLTELLLPTHDSGPTSWLDFCCSGLSPLTY